MKHIAFLSFGKDSIAQLIKIKELGLPLDEVVYVDIRYTPEISGEHPIMAADAAIFIERIDEIPLLPKIGVDPDFSTDKFVAMIEKTITAARAANRQNDCPFQIQDGDEWFCGKITDARVVCPDMADFKACGGYPYKKFKDFCEELNRKATKIIEQYRGDK